MAFFLEGMRPASVEAVMPTFVVVVQKGRDAVAERMREFDEEKVFALTQDSWLVSYEGTTQNCAEHLHIRGEKADLENNTGVVFKISNYSGRFNTNVWEWLKLEFNNKGEL